VVEHGVQYGSSASRFLCGFSDVPVESKSTVEVDSEVFDCRFPTDLLIVDF